MDHVIFTISIALAVSSVSIISLTLLMIVLGKIEV
ncbi:MAG: hypothetical protein ACI909_003470 [Planctomycetota bacterium]|jgi:hypothetical protein